MSTGGTGWEIKVRPGFVNGDAPIYKRQKSDDEGNITEEEISLLDEPFIPIPEGAFSLVPTEMAFFKAKGVSWKSPLSLEGDTVTMDVTDRAEEKNERSLSQVQVYIAQARPTYKLTADVIGNVVTGQLVDYNVMIDTQAMDILGRRPLIRVGTMPDKNLNIGTNQPGGGFAAAREVAPDDGIDYLLIATIYFLGPQGEGSSQVEAVSVEPPGGSHEVYVKHNVFWNLNYAEKNDRPFNLAPWQLDPTLAFLVGRYTVAPAALLGAAAAFAEEQFAAAFNTPNEGKFWTA
jgi:hypothetical protein